MIAKTIQSDYKVNWVSTVEFPLRKFPLVYLHNGELSYSLVSYLSYEYKSGRGKNSSSLYDLFRVVAELTLFYNVNKDKHVQWGEMPHQLVIDYFGARLHGTIINGDCSCGLFWHPLKYQTIKKLINALKGYENFCSTYLNTTSMKLNEILPSHVSRYKGFKKDTSFNLLSHLNAGDDNPIEHGTGYSYETNASLLNEKGNDYKYFDPEYIFEFIDREKNINYKAAYLLCAFCGLRISEALHILINDIVQSTTSLFHDVILSEPFGLTWDHQNSCKIERTYILDSYRNPDYFSPDIDEKDLEFVINPKPRTNEIGKFKAKWKGITVSYDNRSVGYVLEWCDDFARLEFERLIPALLQQTRANHPYLLCKKGGAPLTYGAYEKHISRKSFSLTGETYSSHSLRHFSGYYVANKLKYSLKQAKIFLRHKNITSTDIYFSLSGESMRMELKQIDKSFTWDSLDFSAWGISNAR